MTSTHKNKTLATLLCFLFGAIGLHRFYLRGLGDRWGWLHLLSLPATAALVSALPEQSLLISASPLLLSMLVASIETFVVGLMPDEQWDARWNADSGHQTSSRWPVPLLMVANLFYGATLLLTVLARALDLMLTGGAYG